MLIRGFAPVILTRFLHVSRTSGRDKRQATCCFSKRWAPSTVQSSLPGVPLRVESSMVLLDVYLRPFVLGQITGIQCQPIFQGPAVVECRRVSIQNTARRWEQHKPKPCPFFPPASSFDETPSRALTDSAFPHVESQTKKGLACGGSFWWAPIFGYALRT